MVECRARVIQSYSAVESSTAISLDAGDEVDVLRKDALWWFVVKGDRKGYFPASCLQEIIPVVNDLPAGWQMFKSSAGGESCE